jgi:hypothetical protein
VPKVSLTVAYEDGEGGTRADISKHFSDCLLDLCYRERLNNCVLEYSLDCRLADPSGFFRDNLAFDTWASLQITIHQAVSWGMGRQINKQLPKFFISAIEMSSNKGSGTTMHLTCSSVPPQSQLRTQRSSVAYPGSETNEASSQSTSGENASAAENSGDDIGDENMPENPGTIKQPSNPVKAKNVKAGVTDLRSIAADVCKRNGWELSYLTSVNPQLTRFDQHSHSQSKTLDRLCADNNLMYGLTNGTLIIRSMADIVKQQPVAMLVCPAPGVPGGLNGQGMITWSFSKNTDDTYGSCECSYTDATTGATATATATDSNQPEGAPTLEDHDLPNEFGAGDLAEFERE